jgi:hypothetical protein
MKKYLAALLLLFAGCVSATRPMGAVTEETGGDGEKNTLTDSFVAAPPEMDPPSSDAPAAAPAMLPPSGGPVPNPTPTPMSGALPEGDDTAGGNFPERNREIAYVSPGPIDPKTDQGVAEGLLCTTRHLKLGPSFTQIVVCKGDTPVLSGAEPTISLKFLLEKDTNEGQGPSKIWVPETEGTLVRLVYLPAGKEAWEATFIESLTDATPDDGNVEFTGIPTASGSISLTVLKDKLVGPLHSGWQTFANKDAFEFYKSLQFFGIFIPVGNIKVIPQMTIQELDWKRSRPSLFIRDTFPSEP